MMLIFHAIAWGEPLVVLIYCYAAGIFAHAEGINSFLFLSSFPNLFLAISVLFLSLFHSFSLFFYAFTLNADGIGLCYPNSNVIHFWTWFFPVIVPIFFLRLPPHLF
jgi:hypothetical protein